MVFGLSKKGIYALRAVLEMSHNGRSSPMQIREIAKAQRIPQHYLEQILLTLKNAGYLKSYRGIQGGYSLALPPEQITVLDVLELFEGKVSVAGEDGGNSSLSFFWVKLEDELKKNLFKSIAELVEERERLEQKEMYFI